MKLLLHCVKCPGLDAIKPILAEVEDNGMYLLTCENGHQSIHTLSNPKFEILFEMALLALLDGYTREAVATLAASVEEFYRFFIKVVLVKKGMYEGERYDELSKFWRLVNLSERQIGAFSALYLLEKGEIPSFPDKKSTEFRNDVIHKGKIPKFEEVVKYGDRIVKFLVPLWKEYQEGFNHMIATSADIVSNIKEEHKKMPKVGSYYPTTISRMLGGDKETSFNESLSLIKESNFLFLRK